MTRRPDTGTDAVLRRADEVLDDWQLRRDGDESWSGGPSLVIPVRRRDGAPVGSSAGVLKIGAEDPAGRQEALALQHWGGRGAARLIRADPRRRALLCERLDRRDLTTVDDDEACRVVADLWTQLHIAPPGRLADLDTVTGRRLAALAELPRDAPVPRRFVEHALSVGRDLVADTAEEPVLLHGNLHHGHVLAAHDGRWLAISPDPLAGDRHAELAPLLAHRLPRDPRAVVRRRLYSLVDLADLDPDRARDWVIVRMMLEAHRALTDRDHVTRCVTVAKAVLD